VPVLADKFNEALNESDVLEVTDETVPKRLEVVV